MGLKGLGFRILTTFLKMFRGLGFRGLKFGNSAWAIGGYPFACLGRL